MDYLGILNDHLLFIERFYNTAAEPFESTKRNIDSGEEPFVPKYEPWDHDGPEYLDKWRDAGNNLRVLDSYAFGLVDKALHDYLRAFAMRKAAVGHLKSCL